MNNNSNYWMILSIQYKRLCKLLSTKAHNNLQVLPYESQFTVACKIFFRFLNQIPVLRSRSLKGLGHAILGNFSTDGMVIELTKISK